MNTSFADAVTPIMARHVAHHAQLALEQLGADVARSLAELDPGRRAKMVDRLVRNLRLPVDEAPALERELLRATHSEPHGLYQWPLGGATAFVELRSGIRYLGTWLGYRWSELSKIQALVGNVARWVQSSGPGALQAIVDLDSVHCELSFLRAGFDAKLVLASPFVAALGEVVTCLRARDDGDAVRITFDLQRAT